MLSSLSAAALAGLVGSPHCMGMCGGFATACGAGRKGAAWHVGRLTTYAILGALAGTFGAILPGPPWASAVVSSVLLVWFAAALAGLVPEPRIRLPGLTRISTRVHRREGFGPGLLLGLSTGLLPCGLVYAALAIPIASGSALAGALSMVAFGLGTVPALIAMSMGARRLLMRDLRARRILAASVLLLGLVSVGMRHGVRPGDSSHGHGHAMQSTPIASVVPERSSFDGPTRSGNDVPLHEDVHGNR